MEFLIFPGILAAIYFVSQRAGFRTSSTPTTVNKYVQGSYKVLKQNGKISYRSPLTRIDLPINFDLNDGFKAAFNLMENPNDCIFITGKASIILFDDLYQLPPVVEREMREVMDRIYQTPYFLVQRSLIKSFQGILN